jgi:hypothetical protein
VNGGGRARERREAAAALHGEGARQRRWPCPEFVLLLPAFVLLLFLPEPPPFSLKSLDEQV